MQYYVFALNIWNSDNALLSDHPPQLDDERYRFFDGVPLTGWFPPHAEYTMDPDYPQSRSIYDLQNNTFGMPVVSKALRSALEEYGADHIEFLPITIRNHRNKIASSEHSIANVLGLTACVDLNRSLFARDALMPDWLFSIKKLVLMEDAIPKDRHIFRLKERPRTHIVTEPLKKAIEAQGLRGMSFVLPEEFNSTFYRCA